MLTRSAAILGILVIAATVHAGPSARGLIQQSLDAHGGKKAFYAMRDVQYRITTKGKGESIERYIFDGEQSLNATHVSNKRNYFLFAFPFKWLDAGFEYRSAGRKTVSGQVYNAVDISYPKGDRFRVFIHPDTHHMEWMLFTNVAERQTEPQLMKFELQEINGLWLATHRLTYLSDWDGNIRGEPIQEETLDQIQFWNGFKPSDF